MAKEFTSKDAKNLIKKHNQLLSELQLAMQEEKSLKENIKNSADALAAKEVLKILQGVPVEELNRDKKGIRVKALIESGYTNLADVWTATSYNLSSIKGISAETANVIKRMTGEFARKTFKEVKIKLSTDNKSKESNNLVKDISVYLKSSENINACNDLYTDNYREVAKLQNDLQPAANGFKWLFTGKANKLKAQEAYNRLKYLYDSGYGALARENIDKLNRKKLTSALDAWADFTVNNVKFYNILEETNPGLLGSDDAVYGLPEDLAREINEECIFPEGLLCTLRRYQEWGVKYILHQEKVLLGDEMGLGKTVQAIAAMVSLKNTGGTHFMVVCPASVVTNWTREITKHSKLRATKIHGQQKLAAFKSFLKTGGVGVTTYETVGSLKTDEDFKLCMIVVDEAHYIKNPEAKRTKELKEFCLKAERLLFMTGTALENRVGEMINLIEILQPKIAKQTERLAFMSSAPEFRNKVAPVYYRRKREDVLTELPELTESKEWCDLSKEEKASYEDSILSGRYAEARRVSWNIEDMTKSSKAQRLKEIVEEAESEGRKVLVFSFFLDTVRKITQLFAGKCYGPINGSVNPAKRQEIIDDFEKAEDGSVLAAQIVSGGTGLNIQSASVVVICEPQFKPSIENQAISRAYRMGQSRNVLVYRLLAEETIDERITDILEEKQKIFDAFADKSVSAEQSLNIDETTFGDIIKEEINRINNSRSRNFGGEEKENNG